MKRTDELAQDVVVRLLRGDSAGADPDRGRFRDLLKVAVRNMVRNYWDKKRRRKCVDFDVSTREDWTDGESGPWEYAWTKTVLKNVWARLGEYEQANAGSNAFTLLRFRADNPDDSSEELAAKLSSQLGRTIRADSTRQQLRRARVRFAEMLIDELTDGIDSPNANQIEEELVLLGLLEYVRGILPHDWKSKISRGRVRFSDCFCRSHTLNWLQCKPSFHQHAVERRVSKGINPAHLAPICWEPTARLVRVPNSTSIESCTQTSPSI